MIALIDMDSTLCDYHGAMEEAFEKAFGLPGIEVWKYKEFQNIVKRVPGFWRNLKLIPKGETIVRILKAYGFEPHILTKGPYKTTSAWTEKVEWCREHMPGVPVTITEDKGLVYGKVLVDDWPPYCESWLQFRPRGLVIMPAYPHNEGFDTKHPDRVVRLENNWSDVSAMIERAAKRVPGEPL